MIQVSVANSARLYMAELEHVDPRLGLALVKVTDPELKDRLEPLPLGEPVRLDDEFDLFQIGRENLVERSTGRVVRAEAGSTGLRLRLKTTCADPGQGQAAISDGKVVGLLISTNRSRQEGVLLSLETVRHYLVDLEDGEYRGLPGGGMWTLPLLRDDLRAFYGVGGNQHGVVVSRVIRDRTGHGVVEPGDVLLSVDGFDLDDEGKFMHPVHGRLDVAYLFRGSRYAGDRIRVRLLRRMEVSEAELELKAWPGAAQRVPEAPRKERPRFLVVGGLVILELNQSTAANMSRTPGGVILRRYRERAAWDQPTERKRIVYVDRILADQSNKGFEKLHHAPIETVNGEPIHSILDVRKALETPVAGGFHLFRFEGLESDFVIEAAALEEIDERIARTYKVTLLRHLG
jgi:hypothetical protein